MTLTFAGDRINVHYCVRQWQVVVSVSRAHNAVYRQQVFAIGRCYATGAPGGYATGGELVPARGSHSAVHAATCTTAKERTQPQVQPSMRRPAQQPERTQLQVQPQ